MGGMGKGLDLSVPLSVEARRELAFRLLEKSVPDGRCLVWQGRIRNGTHGAISVGDRSIYVHRLAYAAFKGPIAKNLVVMHVCDNSLCVFHGHLILGTQLENINDMIAKDRHKPIQENIRRSYGRDS